MFNEELTYLEEKLLKELIRPAITKPRKTDWFYKGSIGQELDFKVLLKEIKDLYHRDNYTIGYVKRNWEKLLREI